MWWWTLVCGLICRNRLLLAHFSWIELTNTAVPVDIDFKLDMSSDSLLNGETCIGVSWNHTLGLSLFLIPFACF
jgi:hypothetical protein